MVGPLQEISVRSEREEVGVAQYGELRFEPQQVALRGAIELPLLRSGVAAVALGDVARDGKCGEDQRVGGGFGLAARHMAYDAKHFATQRDGFLPDFEITHTRCHDGKNGGHAERLRYL